MKASLGKKVGPLPLGAWLLIAGGSLGVIVLIKKGKSATTKTEGTTETEAEQLKKKELEEVVQGIESGLPSQGAGGSAGGGTGGGEVNTPVTPTVTPTAVEPAPATAPVETPIPATPAPVPVTAKSKVTAAAPAKAQFGQRDMGRKTLTGKVGAEYTSGKYKGLAAHIYDTAVQGGVGPNKNIVVLNASKKTHAAQGQHQPAHAKDKTPAQKHVTSRTPRAPATIKHTTAKAQKKAAPKKKIAARAPAKTASPPKKKVKR